MIASQFLFMAEYFGRLDPRWRSLRARSASTLRRLHVALRRLRPHPPLPPLSDHLYRDIGIERPPKPQDPYWYW
jgi:hypothetical protein